MNSNPQNPMADTIRRAFRESGLSIKRLSKLSGVPYATCHGFVNGTRDAMLSSACRMCEVLSLELRPKKRESR